MIGADTPPLDVWAQQAADDLVGAIVQAPAFAHLVRELVDFDDLDPRHYRLLHNALDLPTDADDGGGAAMRALPGVLRLGHKFRVSVPALRAALGVRGDGGPA